MAYLIADAAILAIAASRADRQILAGGSAIRWQCPATDRARPSPNRLDATR